MKKNDPKVSVFVADSFEELTGLPVLLNTSLNVNGKPIAGRVIDSLETFYKSDLDVLVCGDTLKEKAI